MPREAAPCKHIYLGRVFQNAVSPDGSILAVWWSGIIDEELHTQWRRTLTGQGRGKNLIKNGLWGDRRGTCPDRKPGGLGNWGLSKPI